MSTPERRPTFTEQARREQLIEVTIDQVAEHGFAGASLSTIASAAGVSKAAVLYHVKNKDELVRAARARVIDAMVEAVGSAVDAATPREAPAAYVRSMVAHLRDHPRHVRMLIESGAPVDSEGRWGPLADLLVAADLAPAPARDGEARHLAVVVSGGIDAIISELVGDPAYDSAAAADLLARRLVGG